MESPFDHLFKDFESKSSKKNTKGKKGWLLSKQYLQPLEEPDDVDKESDIDPSVKNKLRCICRSAFYGMKEGLLTGIFLGGFYGVLKFLNGSSSAFFGSNGGGENYNNERGEVAERYYGGGVRKERKSPARNRRADARAHPSVGRKQSSSRSGSISYQEKLSSYRTIEETIYGYTKESKPQNYASKRFRNIDLSYSKLPVRTDKYLGSSSPRVDDKRKYSFGRTSEKVEIVGYAFIKTTGAFETESTSVKSIEYGSPRHSKSELEKKEKEEEEEEEEQEPYPQKNKSSIESSATYLSRRTSDSLKSPEKSSYTVRETSTKSFKSKESGLSEKHERSAKSLKSKESVLVAKHEKSAKSLRIGESLLSAKQEKSIPSVKSGSPSVIDDSVPPTRVGSEREPRESISKGLQKALSSLKGAASKNKSKQSVINEMDEERQKPSRITIVSPKYTSRDSSQVRSAEQSSSVLIKSLEPDQSDISTRPTKELSQDSRLRTKESSKTNKGVSKHSVRSSIIVESDPSTPDASEKSSRATVRTSERSKSRIDDSTMSEFRDYENLYPSVHAPSYLVNADEVSNGYGSPSLITSQEQQSEHDTIHSKYSESSFSPDIEGSKGELDDVGFTGSNISEFQMRSPFRTFSPSLSTTQTDHIRTPQNSAWSFSAIHDSTTIHAEESASVVPEFKDESNFTLKTTKQSRSVIFSESGRSVPHTERSNLSGLPSVQPSEKSFLLSEQVSGKSPLASSYDKSLLSSDQVSGRSHAASSYDTSLLSNEQLSAKSHVRSSYDKSLPSNEQVSGKSHVGSSYDKSLLSSEQLSAKSHVRSSYDKSLPSNEELSAKSRAASSYDKSLLSSDQVSGRSHAASSYDTSLLSNEQLSAKSHVRSSYDKSLSSNEQLSAKSHVASSYDKSLLSKEQLSAKSHVRSSYDKSLSSNEQLSAKSHVASSYDKSLLSKEQLSAKSHVRSSYDKSLPSNEQLSAKSHIRSSYDKSLSSNEQLSAKSHVGSSYDKSLLSKEQLSAKSRAASSYDKSLLSKEQLSAKSHVASSYDKSLLSSEQVSGKSHVADEYPSEKSLLSSERLTTDRSRVSPDQYSQRLHVRSHESSKKSYPGGMAKSNSSLIQDVGPDVSRSSMAKGAPVASRAHKASPDQEEPTGFGVLSSVSDNTIVLCACNCAIVLGILCTVISTTKASLKI